MLRLLVLFLLLGNGAYFAWSQGMLQPYGFAPVQQREPQRVEQQIKPEALRILPADELRKADTIAAASAAPRPPECLQAGLFDEKQTALIRQALEAALPASVWSLESAVEPGRWMVYMGRFPTVDALNRKKAELRGLKISFEAPLNPSMEPGLSLGSHDSQASASRQLGTLEQRGVRTARVVQDRPELRGQVLRFNPVDDVLRPRLDEFRTVLAGKPLRACK